MTTKSIFVFLVVAVVCSSYAQRIDVFDKKCQCKDGLPGKPGPMGPTGIKGDPGRKGYPGEIGIDGIKGDPGYPGEKGEKGIIGYPGPPGYTLKGEPGDCGLPGLPGMDGAKGELGMYGQKGEQGYSGPKGNTGPPGVNGPMGYPGHPGPPGRPGNDGRVWITNWKECFIDDLGVHENNTIKVCPFRKRLPDTYLKVVVTSNMGIVNCTDCCKTWSVTFNGKECKPSINGLLYMHKGKTDKVLLQSKVLQGHCQVKAKHYKRTINPINVALNVADCQGYKNKNNGLLVSNDMPTRIYIEEVVPPQDKV